MNTVKSVYYGWGSLIVAGAGAYYFAKKSINADRAAKAEADHKRRVQQYQLEQQHLKPATKAPVNAQQPMQSSISSTPASQTTSSLVAEAKERRAREGNDWVEGSGGGPSQEASQDPAPTRHAPEDEEQKEKEKSKYEANEVFRSRKGDRFS